MSASAGLDQLAADDFDCVVSDYDMPDQNGVEFLETIREESPDLPFILYTGKGSEEVASDAISAGVTDYVQKESGTSQYAVLANRVINAVEQYRANQRAAELDRIRTLVSNITQELIHAESREKLETRLCETLTAADPYVFAWIGEVNQTTNEIEPRAAAGIEGNYLDEITVTIGESPTAKGPTGRAVRERELVTTQSIPDDPDYEPWRDDALEYGFRSSAAIPLVYEQTSYGVLNLYSQQKRTFDESERELLTELGEDIAHAFHSLEVQAQLRAERDRRHALFKNTPTPVIVGEVHEEGAEHRIIDVNHAFENVFGYDAEEVIGMDVAEVVVPDEGKERHEEFRERATAGEPTTEVVERLTTDGPREFLLHIIPYGMEGKGADGWYAWYTEITERKEREQQLRLMEQIVQEMNDGAVIFQDGTVQFTNPTVSELVGYSEDELADRRIGEFIAPEYRETVQERHRDRIAGDDDDLLEMYEIELLSKDGPRILVEIHVSRITYEGQPATLSLIRDIGERREREQELERERDRLAAIYEAIPEPLVHVRYVENRPIVETVNPAFEETFGYDEAKIEGRSLNDLIVPEDRQEEASDIDQAALTGSFIERETERLTADGRREFLFRASTLDDAGEADEGIGIYIDIDERREREQAIKRQNERLDKFASVVSHDLRNPLNVAAGRLELAREECDSDNLDATANAVDRSLTLIDDLLTLAREGDQVSEFQAVDLGETIAGCWQNVETTDATLVSETDRTIRADASRLKQLLENLIRNAVEHGGDEVTIKIGDLENGFYVADDGPGIPSGERDQVFEAGYSTAAEGAGFGLNIAQEIANAHGWTISVTESWDGGARFEITGSEFTK